MPEYIERETAIEKSRGGVIYLDDIKEIPSADVAPVRHGWWITKQKKDTFAGYLYSYECSECGRVEKCKEPYCHCGAKMDGGEVDG